MAERQQAHQPWHRTLGETGLQVSSIGFGASPLGNVFGDIEPEESLRAVHTAIDHGIIFFDVAPYYGHTLAESRLGSALAGKRHAVTLATKCGRTDLTDFDFSPPAIAHSVEASLQRLQTDYVDLLQVHDVEFGDPARLVDETLPALFRLQDEGKARAIGMTGYSLDTLIRIAEQADVDTILSYCHWNLLSRDMDAGLTPLTVERGIGLINASPLHMGVLSPAGAPAWHPAPPLVHTAGRAAAAVCERHHVALPEMALRFCLRHPHVASTLVGMATEEQVLANLKALEQSEEADAVIAELEQVLAPALNISWPSGRPTPEKQTEPLA